MTEDDYRFMLADSRAKVLVVSEALLPKFTNLIGSSPDLMHVIVAGNDCPRASPVRDLLAHAMRDPRPRPTTRDDICFWLYTSGSTGRPKGAVHVHANLRLTADLYGGGVLGLKKPTCAFRGQAVFRLWARQRPDLSDGGRRHHHPLARPARRPKASPRSCAGIR
jgi:acyl-coenzyme A synthetase/AMP-(fatty) acid ligase